ncbi:hypothetical protein HS088_TW04G01273 [Tripterygium wilfordii]|uniref:Late embryogenesis abundant protein At5g17165-like n=1 Tax=Tripterygium wilfordii TaxID=458696 RepID=A0A7J7DT46_TRIWF|nr:late embryogenesis abundant protein At5g17165-like [Tripterygium wilfordii]KAF5749306.1 hypothetical protein HS088_TW04G01273 [Tripterygium wilfordii]
MAANSSSVSGIRSLGKRVVNQIISTRFHSAFTARKAAHTSVYDKNFEDQVRPAVVPDELIQPESDKYWAPHPKTGVFGPATEHSAAGGGEDGAHSSAVNGGQDSVLEEKAWFRPTSIEDLEKPHLP